MLQAADSYYWYLALSPNQIKDGLLKARKMEYLIADTNQDKEKKDAEEDISNKIKWLKKLGTVFKKDQ